MGINEELAGFVDLSLKYGISKFGHREKHDPFKFKRFRGLQRYELNDLMKKIGWCVDVGDYVVRSSVLQRRDTALLFCVSINTSF